MLLIQLTVTSICITHWITDFLDDCFDCSDKSEKKYSLAFIYSGEVKRQEKSSDSSCQNRILTWIVCFPMAYNSGNCSKYPLELICGTLLSSMCNVANRVFPFVIYSVFPLLCIQWNLSKGKIIILKDHLEMDFNLRAREPEIYSVNISKHKIRCLS